MDLGVGPPPERAPCFLFSFSGSRMGRPAEEPVPAGGLWDRGNGKWAISALRAPFLFWSVQPPPRPHRDCRAGGSPAGGWGGAEPLGRGEGSQPRKPGFTSQFLAGFELPLIKSPRGSPPLDPQGGGGWLTCPGLPVRLSCWESWGERRAGPPLLAIAPLGGPCDPHPRVFILVASSPFSDLEAENQRRPWPLAEHRAAPVASRACGEGGGGRGSPNPCSRPEWRVGHSGLLGRL